MEKTPPPGDAAKASADGKGQISTIPASIGQAYPSANSITPLEWSALNTLGAAAWSIAALVAFFSNPIGWAAGVILLVSLLGATLPALWPATPNSEIWNSLSEFAVALVRKELEAHVIDAATMKTRALIEHVRTLTKNLQTWIDSGKTDGRRNLDASVSFFLNGYVPEMQMLLGENRSVILPQYVQASLHYVGALRAIYEYADELGVHTRSADAVQGKGKALILQRIREAIEKFTDTAIVSYRNGLQQIVAPPQSAQSNKPTWVEYNKYRNTMTQGALDFLAFLPYFDPERYPTVPPTNWINRRLITILDTDPNIPANHAKPENILTFDASATKPEPIGYLEMIEHGYSNHSEGISYHFDGLVNIRCRFKSIDGFDFTHANPVTGLTGIFPFWNIELSGEKVYYAGGSYWNNVGNPYPLIDLVGSIMASEYHVANATGRSVRMYRKFGDNILIPYEGFSFHFPKQENPPALAVEKPLSLEGTSEILYSIKADRERMGAFTYLYFWQYKLIPRDLLLSKEIFAKEHHVLQLHAIRAARSIVEQDLNIHTGPGFTGGDLILLRPGTQLEFRFVKDTTQPDRWFKGAYNARIWYVLGNDIPDGGVEISINSEGNNSMATKATYVFTRNRVPPRDMTQLQYADLQFAEFKNNVIGLFAFNTEITVSLKNANLTGSILVDRIELAFSHEATHFAADANEQQQAAEAPDAGPLYVHASK